MKNPISNTVKNQLASNPFYSECCIADEKCSSGKIDWHHNFRKAGKNLSLPCCLLPLCVYHHSIEKRTDVKEKLDWIMLSRMTSEEKELYLSSEWLQREKYLTTKFRQRNLRV